VTISVPIATSTSELFDPGFNYTYCWIYDLTRSFCELKRRIDATYSMRYSSAEWVSEHESIHYLLAWIAHGIEEHRQYLCALHNECKVSEYKERLRRLNETLEKTHRDAVARKKMRRAVALEHKRGKMKKAKEKEGVGTRKW
jgi:hypothetical protein